MKERVQKLLKLQENFSSAETPMVGTFHSICVQILRREIQHLGRESRFVIYDDTDQKAVLRQIYDELHIDPKQYNPKAVLGAISWAKAHMLGPDNYVANSKFTAQVAEIYPRYQKALFKNNGLDFDDLLMVTVQLFQRHPAILDKYQEKWPFICVDEYQDTNEVQSLLTNLLAEKYRNLCVVGDPDQSIYSWRGANIQNILDFRKKYPEAKEIKLEQNYRSSGVILEAANATIQKNKNRQDKKLWTERAGGEKIYLLQLRDEREEAEFVAREIESRVRDGRNRYKDCVVLYRTNAQSRVIEELFLRHALPHRIIGGVKFYARKEVKDVLSYLRLIQNSADNLSLLRVINTPPRKIGAKTIEVLQECANSQNRSLWEILQATEKLPIPASKQEVLRQFADDVTALRQINQTEPVAAVIKNVLNKTKLKDYWSQEGTAEGETRYENVLELISVASKYNELEPGVSLETFLEEVALLTDADQRADDEHDVITLMTLHAAKGLEFPVVFLVGLEQNIFPNSRTLLEPRQLEEERRLFYVGLTRAEDQIFLLHARQRLFFGEIQVNAPSIFLDDIPRELLAEESQQELARRGFSAEMGSWNEDEPVAPASLPKFAVGDQVRHPVFGSGLVKAVTGGVVEVNFGGATGMKKLALSIAPLEKI
jgi:DNA helicase-2/ATP-dependent DNA helicase PcrA